MHTTQHKLETTVLGNRTVEHQKAFFEFLGAVAFHFGYHDVMLASDSIPAGCLFNWNLDTSDTWVYRLSKTSLFTRSGRAGTTAFLNPVFWLELTSLLSLVRGGVATLLLESRLTRWRSWLRRDSCGNRSLSCTLRGCKGFQALGLLPCRPDLLPSTSEGLLINAPQALLRRTPRSLSGS